MRLIYNADMSTLEVALVERQVVAKPTQMIPPIKINFSLAIIVLLVSCVRRFKAQPFKYLKFLITPEEL